MICLVRVQSHPLSKKHINSNMVQVRWSFSYIFWYFLDRQELYVISINFGYATNYHCSNIYPKYASHIYFNHYAENLTVKCFVSCRMAGPVYGMLYSGSFQSAMEQLMATWWNCRSKIWTRSSIRARTIDMESSFSNQPQAVNPSFSYICFTH